MIDKKRARTYVYHATEKPKIVYEEDAQKYYDDGWAESPAAFFDMKKHGLNPDDEAEVQIVGETIKGVKDAANGALNLEEMTKKELIGYASVNYGKDLDNRWKRDKLLKKVQGYVDGA